MEEQNHEQALPPKTNSDEVKEAQAIIELKAERDALKKENESLKDAKAQYYDKLLNDNDPPAEDNDPTKQFRSSEEIRKEMAETSSQNTNLRNAELSVELDEAVRRETGASSYLPHGHDEKGVPYSPTQDEIVRADRAHDMLVECIKEANGDPAEFNLALKRRKL